MTATTELLLDAGDQNSPQRRYGEALPIEHFYESDDDGTIYGVPTLITEGIEVPSSPVFDFVSLELLKAAASGDRTARVVVYGYRRFSYTQASNENAARASSGYWMPIFDTGAQDGGAADWNESWLLEGAFGFHRLAARIVTNGGTTPVLSAIFAFHKERRNA